MDAGDHTILFVASTGTFTVLVLVIVTCISCDRKGIRRISSSSDSRQDTVPLDDLLSKPSLADPESIFSEANFSPSNSDWFLVCREESHGVGESENHCSPTSEQKDNDFHYSQEVQKGDEFHNGKEATISKPFFKQSHGQVKSCLVVRPQPVQPQHTFKEIMPALSSHDIQSAVQHHHYSERQKQEIDTSSIYSRSPSKPLSNKNISGQECLDSTALKIHRNSVTKEGVHFLSSSRCSFSHEAGHTVHGNQVPRPSIPFTKGVSHYHHTAAAGSEQQPGQTEENHQLSGNKNNHRTDQGDVQSRINVHKTSNKRKDSPMPDVVQSSQMTGSRCDAPSYSRDSKEGHHELVSMRRCLSYVHEDDVCSRQANKPLRNTFSLNLTIDVHFPNQGGSRENIPTVTCSPIIGYNSSGKKGTEVVAHNSTEKKGTEAVAHNSTEKKGTEVAVNGKIFKEISENRHQNANTETGITTEPGIAMTEEHVTTEPGIAMTEQHVTTEPGIAMTEQHVTTEQQVTTELHVTTTPLKTSCKRHSEPTTRETTEQMPGITGNARRFSQAGPPISDPTLIQSRPSQKPHLDLAGKPESVGVHETLKAGGRKQGVTSCRFLESGIPRETTEKLLTDTKVGTSIIQDGDQGAERELSPVCKSLQLSVDEVDKLGGVISGQTVNIGNIVINFRGGKLTDETKFAEKKDEKQGGEIIARKTESKTNDDSSSAEIITNNSKIHINSIHCIENSVNINVTKHDAPESQKNMNVTRPDAPEAQSDERGRQEMVLTVRDAGPSTRQASHHSLFGVNVTSNGTRADKSEVRRLTRTDNPCIDYPPVLKKDLPVGAVNFKSESTAASCNQKILPEDTEFVRRNLVKKVSRSIEALTVTEEETGESTGRPESGVVEATDVAGVYDRVKTLKERLGGDVDSHLLRASSLKAAPPDKKVHRSASSARNMQKKRQAIFVHDEQEQGIKGSKENTGLNIHQHKPPWPTSHKHTLTDTQVVGTQMSDKQVNDKQVSDKQVKSSELYHKETNNSSPADELLTIEGHGHLSLTKQSTRSYSNMFTSGLKLESHDLAEGESQSGPSSNYERLTTAAESQDFESPTTIAFCSEEKLPRINVDASEIVSTEIRQNGKVVEHRRGITSDHGETETRDPGEVETRDQETCKGSDESDYDNPWDDLDDAVKRASIRYNRRPSRIAAGDTKNLLLKSAEDLGRLLEEAEKKRQLRQAINSCQMTSLDSENMTIPFTRFSPLRHTVKGILTTPKLTSAHSMEVYESHTSAILPKLNLLRHEDPNEPGNRAIDARRPMSLTSKVRTRTASRETKKQKK